MLNPGAALIGIAFTLVHPQQQTLARVSAPSSHAVVLAKASSLPGNTIMQINPDISSNLSGVQNFPIMLVQPTLGSTAAGVQNFSNLPVDPPAHGVGVNSTPLDLPVMRVEPRNTAMPLPSLKGSQR